MKPFMRHIAGFVGAVFATSLSGSIFSTQSVIASLQSINVDIPLGTRLAMTVDDLGILPALGAVTSVGFLIAFIVAALCTRYIGGHRTTWYLAAGATSMIVTLLIMKAVLFVSPIAGARSVTGLLSFGLAGAIGAWVYAKVTGQGDTQS